MGTLDCVIPGYYFFTLGSLNGSGNEKEEFLFYYLEANIFSFENLLRKPLHLLSFYYEDHGMLTLFFLINERTVNVKKSYF